MPGVTERIRGKAGSGTWSRGIPGSVPSLACPTGKHTAQGPCTCLGPGDGECVLGNSSKRLKTTRQDTGQRYPEVWEPGSHLHEPGWAFIFPLGGGFALPSGLPPCPWPSRAWRECLPRVRPTMTRGYPSCGVGEGGWLWAGGS